MDGFNDKKWFVYLGDHHEGPFSLAEIQAKLPQGEVTPRTFVWTEGMGDWKPMSDVPAFSTVTQPKQQTTSVGAQGPAAAAHEPTFTGLNIGGFQLEGQATSSITTAPAASISTQPVSPVAPQKTSPLSPIQPQQSSPSIAVHSAARIGSPVDEPIDLVHPKGLQSQKAASKKPPAPKSGFLKLLLFLALIAGGIFAAMGGYLAPVLELPPVRDGVQTISDASRPYLLRLAEAFPGIADWISPIPQMDDVSAEDQTELKNAAMASMADRGPSLALALSIADPLAPIFYVASNLPDGARFEVHVEGRPDTLLNQLSFSGKVQATVGQRLGKTAPVRHADGKPIPRGEYDVYVYELDGQPEAIQSLLAAAAGAPSPTPPFIPNGRKLLLKETYFLGGIKDATYSSRLKEFHDKLRERSTAELTEVTQFATTLESQFSSTVQEFNRIRKGKVTPLQRKAWDTFATQWDELNSQLAQAIQKTPEALQNEYFHGGLYAFTQQTVQAISRLHGLHHAYFTGSVDPQAFDGQLGESRTQAQAAVNALKQKVTQTEQLGTTPNGMPRREGMQ